MKTRQTLVAIAAAIGIAAAPVSVALASSGLPSAGHTVHVTRTVASNPDVYYHAGKILSLRIGGNCVYYHAAPCF